LTTLLSKKHLASLLFFSFSPFPVNLDFNAPVQVSPLFDVIGGDKVPGTFSGNGNLKWIDPFRYERPTGCAVVSMGLSAVS